MKVLLLTPQPPDPPHQGTALRNLQILRGLAAAHEIDLLAFEPADAKSNIPDSLQALCHKVTVVAEPMRSTSRRLWQMTASTKPDMALRLKDPAYESMLKTMLRENAYDIVQIEGIELAWAAQVVRDISPATPLVYDAHNAEALLQSRAGQADWQRISRWHAALYSFIQSRRLAAYEKWICETADWVTCVSEPDQDAIVRLAPRAAGRITVIPNCIDVASYRPPVDLQLDSHQYDVVFSGKMDYRPNVDAVLWFADEIWPRIRAKKPDARWVVAGQRPHARLQRLEGREDITLTGWVPDILPLLWGGVVFVMPFRVGSGTRLKL
ncbi:MAG: glycosyltransferase, partial [Candidatus Promineifilaceae bacterium]